MDRTPKPTTICSVYIKIKNTICCKKVTDIVVDKAEGAEYNTGVSGIFRAKDGRPDPAVFAVRAVRTGRWGKKKKSLFPACFGGSTAKTDPIYLAEG